jgi:pimeloyl-ACP methyl ester carboxylesterase
VQGVIRVGEGKPLVLLHGVMSSGRAWHAVSPLLASNFDVIVPTMLGHRGGPSFAGAVTVAALVDDIERRLDGLGIDRAHLAGNSLGGWVALELARRGRAETVCALSPAGCWEVGSVDHQRSRARLRLAARGARLTRGLLPLTGRARIVRRVALREVATRGDRVSPRELVDMVDDLLGCDAREELLSTRDRLAPMNPLPCPIVLAWSTRDRLFPIAVNGPVARELLPGAAWSPLDGVGHVPMIDDPQLVARAIRQAADRATGSGSGPGSGRPPGAPRHQGAARD